MSFSQGEVAVQIEFVDVNILLDTDMLWDEEVQYALLNLCDRVVLIGLYGLIEI